MQPWTNTGPWRVSGWEVRVECLPRPRLVASRDGRDLPALPEGVRRHPDLSWIRLSLAAVREHWRGMRQLLEEAMIAQAPFGPADLALLAADPVGRAMAASLLLDQRGIQGGWLPEDGLLDTTAGDLVTIGPPLRVVHPVLLGEEACLAAVRWLLRRGLYQPFRQVRRQCYRPEGEELRAPATTRAAGATIRWDQARAILQGRGWTRVTKTRAERPYAGVRAFLEFRSPAERGFSRENVVTGRLFFQPSGAEPDDRGSPGLPLADVPPIVFSEALRDSLLAAGAARVRERDWT